MVTISEALPALGIVAAVLGVIKAMGALDQSPEVLGQLIGAALVGTFAGIFFSYAVVSPIATKIKIVREKKMRLYIIVKQTLLGVHERRHAAGCARARAQDHLRLRAADHRRGGAGDACRRRWHRSASGTQGSGLTAMSVLPNIQSLFGDVSASIDRFPTFRTVFERAATACAQECRAFSINLPQLTVASVETGTAAQVFAQYEGAIAYGCTATLTGGIRDC